MPARPEIDPIEMRGFLPNVVLIELRRMGDAADAPVDYFIRLAGTQVEQVFGRISAGLLGDALPTKYVQRWRHLFDEALAQGPVRCRSKVGFREQTFLEGEVLVAPLGDGERPAMLFVVFAFWPGDRPPPAR
jgi:hypothetical protein